MDLLNDSLWIINFIESSFLKRSITKTKEILPFILVLYMYLQISRKSSNYSFLKYETKRLAKSIIDTSISISQIFLLDLCDKDGENIE